MNRIMLPLGLLLLIGGLSTLAFSQRPWAPRSNVEQPIPFSHRIHAGVNKIPCQYCHNLASRSSEPGVPSVSRCVGCHGNKIAGAPGSGIQPVMRAWTDHSQPTFEIRWNRVYTLPDFVRFTHRPHIFEGIACQTCHGPVETMERVVPAVEINMGFCVECHTQRHASLDCVSCHH